jgi:Cu(I)/Ag(I) efflux system membrane fusion protein
MRRLVAFAAVFLVAAGIGTAAGVWVGGAEMPLADRAKRLLQAATGTAPPSVPQPMATDHAAHAQTSGSSDHGAHAAHGDHGEGGGAHQHDAAAPAAKAEGDQRTVLYYRNPMGLPDTSPVPKKDSMGMDYIPVYADEAEDGPATVRIGSERVQRLGVRTEAVLRRDLVRPIRAVGTVRYDERRTFIVSTKYDGWIEDLAVNATGDEVREGQTLMQVYSPDLMLAQRDYLLALNQDRRGEGKDRPAKPEAAGRYVEAARQRLDFLDFPRGERRRLEQEGATRRTLAVPAPVTGTVIEKMAIEGMRFSAGDPLYKIVDLSSMWLIAEIFEQDLALVAVGQAATVRLKAYPDTAFAGRVAFLAPAVNTATRTVPVRIEIANERQLLRADMYAEVEIAAPIGRPALLAVPESAVIDNGTRQVVLVDLGDGRFQPRPVRLGAAADGYVEVIEGVGEGEAVVVSANFLIDAESNLRAALDAFAAPDPKK